MKMSESVIISWSVENWITVVLMVAIGGFVLGFLNSKVFSG